jgi:hypothetical protein
MPTPTEFTVRTLPLAKPRMKHVIDIGNCANETEMLAKFDAAIKELRASGREILPTNDIR